MFLLSLEYVTYFAQSREYYSQTGRFTGENLNQNAGSNDAVQIGINGNVVTLDVFVDIRGDVSTTIIDDLGREHCVVDLTMQGIEAWGRVYVGPFSEVIAVEVNVHQMHPRQQATSAQNFIPVNIVDGPGVSRLIGGWTPNNPGTIHLYTHFRNEYDDDYIITHGERRTWWQFIYVSAHEFGHGFGVNDANRESREGRIPRPRADMLRNVFDELMGYGIHSDQGNMYISRHSIQMMIYAIMSGDWQRFMEYERGSQSITLDASLPKNQISGSEVLT